jgi:hypothetical protein
MSKYSNYYQRTEFRNAVAAYQAWEAAVDAAILDWSNPEVEAYYATGDVANGKPPRGTRPDSVAAEQKAYANWLAALGQFGNVIGIATNWQMYAARTAALVEEIVAVATSEVAD